jgi:hypothetical protein
MIVSVPTAALAFQLVAIADAVPDFDLNPTCRAAAQGIIAGRSKESCLRSENDARDQLKGRWAEFPAADRTRCAQSTSVGGVPSYVEMLTCLEISKQARDLPDETVGRGPSRR